MSVNAPIPAQDLADPERADSYKDTILCGDSWAVADDLPAGMAQCIVTSPPYFGHRNYAQQVIEEQYEFGRETDPDVYVCRLVQLFAKLKPVLAESGTLWLNLGDTYRQNQLLGIPWRVALALQGDGWLLRSEVIWNKPNAMPSSVSNRPTISHEHLFILAKHPDYYYDADAIREPHVTFTEHSKMRGGRNHFGKPNGTPERGKNADNPNLHNGRWDQAFHPLGRNKRTVWDIPLGKFRDAHFAVFPAELVETCISAGSAKGDLVLDPFMGSGTTAIVAKENGRGYLGIELVSAYVSMAEERLKHVQLPLL